MPEARVNNVRLHYEINGQGYPVVFIHGGFGGVGTTVNPSPPVVLPSIPQDKYQVVTYDRRCAGSSEYVLDWYNLEDIANDTRALMQHLGFDKYVVIGSSMGGMVALQYTLLFPGTVSALALLNTGPDLMTHTHWGQSFAKTAERVKQSGDDVEFERVREKLRHPPAPDDPRAKPFHEQYTAKLAAMSDDDLKLLHSGTVRNYGAFVGYDFSDRLSAFTMPTLIIHGNADTTVPFEYSEQLHRGIPHASFHEIEGAGHGITANQEAQAILHRWLVDQA